MKSTRHFPRSLRLLPGLLASTAAAQGTVHVVDVAGGAGSHFTSLADAVTAAADGDVLLVRSGDYVEGISFDGKGLVVVAEAGANVTAEYVHVENLPVNASALVQGVSLDSEHVVGGSLAANSGPVWFERTDFLGQPILSTHGTASGALVVFTSDSVVLSGCTLTRPYAGGPLGALDVNGGSRVHVHGSELGGQANGTGAIEVAGSFLELVGSTAQGGAGADGSLLLYCTAEDGGHGLVVTSGAEATLLDSSLSGGPGGAPCGVNGQALVQSGGSAATLPGTATGYELTSPVRDDEGVTATVRGAPGDQVWLLGSKAPGPGLSSRFWDGELLVGPPLQSFSLGTIPASGVLSVTGVPPTLAPGQESCVFFTQVVVRSAASGHFRVGSPSAVVVVDDAF